MCNLSDLIEEKALRKGEEKGVQKGRVEITEEILDILASKDNPENAISEIKSLLLNSKSKGNYELEDDELDKLDELDDMNLF